MFFALPPIECGEITCASEPGKFCRFLCTYAFGSKYQCRLWPDELLKESKPEGGWLLRCKSCLKETQLVEVSDGNGTNINR